MYNNGMHAGISQKLSDNEIARKIFLSYPTDVFKDKLDMEFDIRNRISERFDIPITSIQVSGSAKTGYSYHKEKNFELGISDLDVSIINEKLFLQYMRIAYRTTKGYCDLSKFSSSKGLSGGEIQKSFIQYIGKGLLRPDLLPNCREKEEWFKFFNELSQDYFKIFKNINAGIYCTEFFYEHKQADVIRKFKEERKR